MWARVGDGCDGGGEQVQAGVGAEGPGARGDLEWSCRGLGAWEGRRGWTVGRARWKGAGKVGRGPGAGRRRGGGGGGVDGVEAAHVEVGAKGYAAGEGIRGPEVRVVAPRTPDRLK